MHVCMCIRTLLQCNHFHFIERVCNSGDAPYFARTAASSHVFSLLFHLLSLRLLLSSPLSLDPLNASRNTSKLPPEKKHIWTLNLSFGLEVCPRLQCLALQAGALVARVCAGTLAFLRCFKSSYYSFYWFFRRGNVQGFIFFPAQPLPLIHFQEYGAILSHISLKSVKTLGHLHTTFHLKRYNSRVSGLHVSLSKNMSF